MVWLVSLPAAAQEPPASSDSEVRPKVRNLLGLEAAPLDEPLVSDRPDFTESCETVPWGRLQLEGGYTFSYDRERDRRVKDHTFPEFLLRVGAVEDFEFRVGWAGWSLTEELFRSQSRAGRTITLKEHEDAGTDMTAGFKIHFLDQAGWLPALGLIGELSLPTGAESKTSGDVDPQAKVLWYYGLGERLNLSGNVNLAVPSDEEGRFFQTSASCSVGCELIDQLGCYVEYFGFYPDARGADCAHYINGGFTFLVTDNLQFDVRTGFGLNEEADDLFAGAGFVMRL